MEFFEKSRGYKFMYLTNMAWRKLNLTLQARLHRGAPASLSLSFKRTKIEFAWKPWNCRSPK
jgi:hypothetical protein